MLAVFLMTLVVMGLGISFISIRMILKPGAEFHGTCASRNVNGKEGCVCGRKPGEACQNEGPPSGGQLKEQVQH